MPKAFMHLKHTRVFQVNQVVPMPAHHYSHFPHLSLTPDLLRLTSESAELRLTRCAVSILTRVLPVMHLVA